MEQPRGLGRVRRVRRARVALGLLGASFLLSGSRTAKAQEEAEAAGDVPATKAHFGGQRSIGFGPAAGFYTGAGAAVVLDAAPVGLVISGGYFPVLIFGNRVEGKAITFDYYGSEQISGDVLIGPLYRHKRVTIDFMFGYRYNTVLGSGIGVGARIAYDLSRVISLEGDWVPSFFPGAVGHLQDKGYPKDRDPSLPWFQGGLGVSLVFYP